ncbi:MAG: hypothetical protein M1504_02010 [Candidatus Marsarchaeota archaeon]|nr:hypothetical protein [Candidatus Marsarchaeota archaeon]
MKLKGALMYPEDESSIRTPKKPNAKVVNPANLKVEDIYKNIQDETTIGRIKELEEQLERLRGIHTVEDDIKEMESEDEDANSKEPKLDKAGSTNIKGDETEILSNLLTAFNKLLKSRYGPLGYLVMSDSETIKRLYDIDTDEDFYLGLEQSVIRVSSRRLERMVAGGGGKRWIGERSILIHDPDEVQQNARTTERVVMEIIESIQEQLSQLR